jgi:hypothetical protein
VAAVSISVSPTALAATIIDFEADLKRRPITHPQPKVRYWYTGAPELTFYSSNEDSLFPFSGIRIFDVGSRSSGYALTVASVSRFFTVPSNYLVGEFSSPVDFVSLRFEHPERSCDYTGTFCTPIPDDTTALLRTYDGDRLVGSFSLLSNRNDSMDQTATFGSVGGTELFTRFEFAFTDSAGTLINVEEIVDDLKYNVRQVAPVPEPSTWAMMMLGFGAAGIALRRQRGRKISFRAF